MGVVPWPASSAVCQHNLSQRAGEGLAPGCVHAVAPVWLHAGCWGWLAAAQHRSCAGRGRPPTPPGRPRQGMQHGLRCTPRSASNPRAAQAGEEDWNFDGKPEVIRFTARVSSAQPIHSVKLLLQFTYTLQVRGTPLHS